MAKRIFDGDVLRAAMVSVLKERVMDFVPMRVRHRTHLDCKLAGLVSIVLGEIGAYVYTFGGHVE